MICPPSAPVDGCDYDFPCYCSEGAENVAGGSGGAGAGGGDAHNRDDDNGTPDESRTHTPSACGAGVVEARARVTSCEGTERGVR